MQGNLTGKGTLYAYSDEEFFQTGSVRHCISPKAELSQKDISLLTGNSVDGEATGDCFSIEGLSVKKYEVFA